MAAVLIVFPTFWDADRGVCDAALRRYWRIWGAVHAVRLGATTVVAGLRWRFQPPRPEDPQQDGSARNARRRAAALVANARNSLDAVALIWFVFGNMWLLGGSDDACRDAQRSPIYVVDVVMLVIQYAQICLPCIFAIAMVPVFCFCLPCVIRLLAALQEPNQGRGATRRAINVLQTTTYREGMELGYEEPACPICLRDVQPGDELRVLPCKHLLHKRCVDEWLQRNATCPLCRKSIYAEDAADAQQQRPGGHAAATGGAAAPGGADAAPSAGGRRRPSSTADVTRAAAGQRPGSAMEMEAPFNAYANNLV
mmetsp:Transcript_5971/g.24986  ORF Transcript_5971/g.24986 Transcript_5971/m.24986 type:complete len:311 (+) Transcript_5971:129-1061(+)